jgi:hypothetical protein
MLRDDGLHTPHPHRLSRRHDQFGEIMARHDAAVLRRLPSYRDPSSGLAVFTADFLARRGTCCASGCRHCPFVGSGNDHLSSS